MACAASCAIGRLTTLKRACTQLALRQDPLLGLRCRFHVSKSSRLTAELAAQLAASQAAQLEVRLPPHLQMRCGLENLPERFLAVVHSEFSEAALPSCCFSLKIVKTA